ncbi:unnamed protein product [Merluccius merluccius]
MRSGAGVGEGGAVQQEVQEEVHEEQVEEQEKCCRRSGVEVQQQEQKVQEEWCGGAGGAVWRCRRCSRRCRRSSAEVQQQQQEEVHEEQVEEQEERCRRSGVEVQEQKVQEERCGGAGGAAAGAGGAVWRCSSSSRCRRSGVEVQEEVQPQVQEVREEVQEKGINILPLISTAIRAVSCPVWLLSLTAKRSLEFHVTIKVTAWRAWGGQVGVAGEFCISLRGVGEGKVHVIALMSSAGDSLSWQQVGIMGKQNLGKSL